ncbi:MAG: helix-turn-helix domain-containing protein [Polyangiaceae bacterium]
MVQFLTEERLLPDGIENPRLLFFPLAIDAQIWQTLVDQRKVRDPVAHLRLMTVVAGHRLGALLVEYDHRVPMVLTSTSWATQEGRGEPIRVILGLSGWSQRKLAGRLGYAEESIAEWVRGVRPKDARLIDLAQLAHEIFPMFTRQAYERWLRWHYALADVCSGLARVVGDESVQEAADVLKKLVSCVAKNKKPEKPRLMLACAMKSPFTLPRSMESWLQHARGHGASEEFVQSAASVVPEWRAVLDSWAEADVPELEFLASRLPNRKRAERCAKLK